MFSGHRAPPARWAACANLAVGLAVATLWALLKGYNLHLAETQWGGGAVTAVLVTTRDDELGFPRLPLLLSSLCQQMSAPGLLEELLVVTPDQGLEALTEQLIVCDGQSIVGTAWERGGCRPPFPVRVVPDSAVLPSPRATLAALTAGKERSERGGRGAGYRLQMLLKLGVSELVSTPHYLTLDNDVLGLHQSAGGYVEVAGGGSQRRVSGGGLQLGEAAAVRGINGGSVQSNLREGF